MVLNDRITAFAALGTFLRQFETADNEKNKTIVDHGHFYEKMIEKIRTAKNHNGWFTEDNIRFSVSQWGNLLTQEKLTSWLLSYQISKNTKKSVGIIMAGNIPLVGFHDFLCVLITGNKAIVKQSSNDTQLLPLITEYLISVEPRFESHITFTTEKFTDADMIIATGSNNTARYFEHYFSAKPNIIRKNRNSVAILTGTESKEQLVRLGEDIFRYYGLGCRSVSKIMVPKGYDFTTFFEAIYSYGDIIHETKYANNYDYNKAVYLMSNYQLLENGFLMLKEDPNYGSPIATVFYEFYENESGLIQKLKNDSEKIQCIVSDDFILKSVNFGMTQRPALTDYADNVDVVNFLTK